MDRNASKKKEVQLWTVLFPQILPPLKTTSLPISIREHHPDGALALLGSHVDAHHVAAQLHHL
jgi:hypothetical protein